jgi:hypothetical protein
MFYCSSIVVMLACVLVFPQDNDTTPTAAKSKDTASWMKKIDISGYGAIEGGQVVAGHYVFLTSQPQIEHLWLGSVYADIGVHSTINKYFSILLSLESRMWYTSPLVMQKDNTTWGAPLQNFEFNFPNAKGTLSLDFKKVAAFTLDFGRFEYKYNPQAQDLGEYLFRSGCYPAYLQTNFDLPLARVNGFALSCKLFDFIRQDLLLTTMTDVRPFYDFSLTYMADIAVGKVFDVSGGVQFDHLISVDENETSPKSEYVYYGYLNAPGDTGYYTFAGTKLMLRFMFDPKRFFNAPFFGEKDGIIYAEAAVLGLKNYPKCNAVDTTNILSNLYGYDKLLEKMPIMFGVNVPTFKILDVLSIEGEWFGSKYADSYHNYYNLRPVPATNPNDLTDFDYAHDDWKWAVYAKKTIWGGLSFIGLAGRDHLRIKTFITKDQDWGATLVKNNHWYWMLKLKYSF